MISRIYLLYIYVYYFYPQRTEEATKGTPRPEALSALSSPRTAMLCYVTPKEHLGLPDREDVKAIHIIYIYIYML